MMIQILQGFALNILHALFDDQMIISSEDVGFTFTYSYRTGNRAMKKIQTFSSNLLGNSDNLISFVLAHRDTCRSVGVLALRQTGMAVSRRVGIPLYVGTPPHVGESMR